MRLAVFSDLHLGIKQNDESWQLYAMNWCEWFINKLKENNIEDVVFLGDFFHSRNTISVDTLYTTALILDKLKQFKIHMIYGNHDLYYLNNNVVSAVSLFKHYPNISVYEKPEMVVFGDKKCCMCGWGYDPLNYEGDILFTHAEINAFRYNDKQGECDKGILCSDLLKKYKLVYSGHFHLRQTKSYAAGKIRYVGNPFQMDYSDEGTCKGFDIYDTDTNETTFIENDISPKFLRMKLSEMTEHDIDELKSKLKNSFFKLIIDLNIKLEDLKELMLLINTAGPKSAANEWENGQNFSQDISDNKIEAINLEDCIKQFIDLLDVSNKTDIFDYLIGLYYKVTA